MENFINFIKKAKDFLTNFSLGILIQSAFMVFTIAFVGTTTAASNGFGIIAALLFGIFKEGIIDVKIMKAKFSIIDGAAVVIGALVQLFIIEFCIDGFSFS